MKGASIPWIGLVKGAALLLGLVVVGSVLRDLDLRGVLEQGWVETHLAGGGPRAMLGFVLLSALVTGIGLPRQLVAFAGGYVFGFGAGFALALLGTVLGCGLTLFTARFLGRDLVYRLLPGKIAKVDRVVEGRSFTMALLLRLLPLGSNLLTGVAAGITRTRAGPFIAGSALGYVPQTVVFSLAGSGVHLQPGPRIGLSLALFFISGLLGVHLWRSHGRGAGQADGLD